MTMWMSDGELVDVNSLSLERLKEVKRKKDAGEAYANLDEHYLDIMISLKEKNKEFDEFFDRIMECNDGVSIDITMDVLYEIVLDSFRMGKLFEQVNDFEGTVAPSLKMIFLSIINNHDLLENSDEVVDGDT